MHMSDVCIAQIRSSALYPPRSAVRALRVARARHAHVHAGASEPDVPAAPPSVLAAAAVGVPALP